jgi:hypothetical protein
MHCRTDKLVIKPENGDHRRDQDLDEKIRLIQCIPFQISPQATCYPRAKDVNVTLQWSGRTCPRTIYVTHFAFKTTTLALSIVL